MVVNETADVPAKTTLRFELYAYTNKGGSTSRIVEVAADEWADMSESERLAYMRERLFSSLMVEWGYSEV